MRASPPSHWALRPYTARCRTAGAGVRTRVRQGKGAVRGSCSALVHRRQLMARLRFFSPPLCRRRPMAPIFALQRVDLALLPTSVNASLNLIAVCGFVIWMQKHGHLPANTATVLSQVSFNLVIPCFLMSKVSQTIALRKEANLIGLPLIAIAQILVGLALGKLVGVILYRWSWLSPSMRQQMAIKEALVTTACAFGNCVTLPLVFLSGMLPSREYTIASGYLALFMVGWSPCLWTIGYQLFNSAIGATFERSAPSRVSMTLIMKWLKQIINPPIYGILVGLLVGSTPLSQLLLPAKKILPFANMGNRNGLMLKFFYVVARGFLQPVIEAAKILGSATVALQAIVLASTVASSIAGNNKDAHSTANTPQNVIKEANQSDHAMGISLEGKAFWLITATRLIIMPLVGFALVGVFQHKRWLPTDPLCALTVLVVAAMPTAQNLIVLVQLNSSTRPFATVLANLLVRQYLASAVSLTFWMAIFSSYTHTL